MLINLFSAVADHWLAGQLNAGRAPASWPTSLVSFVNGARELSLPRQPLPQPAAAAIGVPTMPKKDGVKLKKQHEVAVLAALIAAVAQQVGGWKAKAAYLVGVCVLT